MLIVGILLCIAVLVYLRSTREGMTNKDLLDTLKTFGTKSKESTPLNQEPLYGPKTTKIEEPKPSSSRHGDDDRNVYPDIYGPEIAPIPGKKQCMKGKHQSDSACGDAYEFNPDFAKAFPREENEPQPFLTDFSKFQH